MLRIVCVKHGDKYGPEYVNILHDMVMRNLPEGMAGSFTCFTDNIFHIDPAIECRPLFGNLAGWWNKLWLFKADHFDAGDRIVYFDLDTVITGPLDAIVAYDGPFAILRDFYRPDGLQSSVMAWECGKHNGLWHNFQAAGFPEIDGGDQAWIERHMRAFNEPIDAWQDLFAGDFVSYKVSARHGIPKGAKVVVFHGEPRPHEAGDWVPKVWKIGGGTSAELVVTANTPIEEITANIQAAMKRSAPWLQMAEPHDGVAMICAGGPSLAADLAFVKAMAEAGTKVFAVNGSYRYLREHGISPDAQVILDARAENIEFVTTDWLPDLYYSSQCHTSVLDAAGEGLTLWHPFFPGILDIVPETDRSAMIGGGTTAGLKAAGILFALGYRKIHLFGFDSCYAGSENHAYPQPLNNGERILDVNFAGQDFKAAPWMVTQAEDFQNLIPELVTLGCEIVVHGEGLIPAIAHTMRGGEPNAADLRAASILPRLAAFPAPKGVEVGVFAGDLSKRLLAGNQALTLYMVDSWASAPSEAYKASGDFHAGLSQATQDEFFGHTKAVTSFAGDRARILRKPSVDAAREFGDASLDFVFIDADHSYEGCKADIDAWLPKVRPGGIISGHDYDNTEFPCFGVRQAVTELIDAHGLSLELGENFTWFATKKESLHV